MSCPHACITPTSWPLYLARTVLRKGRPIGLGDWKCIHIGAERDDRTRLSAAQDSDDAVASDAGLDLEAERLEVCGDERGGAGLLEGELGMLMDVAPPLDELRRKGRRPLLDVVKGRGIRCLSREGDGSGEEQRRDAHRDDMRRSSHEAIGGLACRKGRFLESARPGAGSYRVVRDVAHPDVLGFCT